MTRMCVIRVEGEKKCRIYIYIYQKIFTRYEGVKGIIEERVKSSV